MNNRNLYIRFFNNKMSISSEKDKFNLDSKNEIYFNNKSVEELKYIKRKKLYINIAGEKIYTTIVELPKLKVDNLNKCLVNEMKHLIKNTDNILYKYKIINRNSKGYKLLVYYVRCNPIKNMKEFVYKNKLKKISLVQTEIFEKISKKIKEGEYGVLFEKNNIVYMLYIKEGEIADNELFFIRDQQYINTTSQIKGFFNQCKVGSKGDFKNVYSLNLHGIEEKVNLGMNTKIIHKDGFIYA